MTPCTFWEAKESHNREPQVCRRSLKAPRDDGTDNDGVTPRATHSTSRNSLRRFMMWTPTMCLRGPRVPRIAAASLSKSLSEFMNSMAMRRCSSGGGPAGGGGTGACAASASSSGVRRLVLACSVTILRMAGGGGRSGGRGKCGIAAPRGGSRMPVDADAPEARLRWWCTPDRERS